MRSVFDEDTEFKIIRSKTPVTVDGVKIGAPTGRVACRECGAEAENVDEIPHDPDCDQRFTHSRWYLESMRSE